MYICSISKILCVTDYFSFLKLNQCFIIFIAFRLRLKLDILK